jgi:hypothetical protein
MLQRFLKIGWPRLKLKKKNLQESRRQRRLKMLKGSLPLKKMQKNWKAACKSITWSAGKVQSLQ